MEEARLSVRRGTGLLISDRGATDLVKAASDVRTLDVSPWGCVYQDASSDFFLCEAVLNVCIPTATAPELADFL